jgi:hypothetical protein
MYVMLLTLHLHTESSFNFRKRNTIYVISGVISDWYIVQRQGSHLSQFSQASPGFMGFKELCLKCPKILVWHAECPGIIKVIKIIIFLAMRKKILTFPQREKTSTGVSQPSSSH